MKVVTKREVFHNGGLGVDAVRCPACGVNQVDGDWSDAIDPWWDGNDDAAFTCEACGAANPITRWIFEPPWGFGCLGFIFWNWPRLKREFVQQLSEMLGHEVLLVVGKI